MSQSLSGKGMKEMNLLIDKTSAGLLTLLLTPRSSGIYEYMPSFVVFKVILPGSFTVVSENSEWESRR